MTPTTPPTTPSSPEAVTQALLDLGSRPEHPFTTSIEGERIVFTWVYDKASGPFGSREQSYRLRITLIPETFEYKRSEIGMERQSGSVSGSYTFNSAKVVGPVKRTLEAHGWHRRRTALGKAIRRLFA
jgi:hypothetical protein